jgi:hypothetical protein
MDPTTTAIRMEVPTITRARTGEMPLPILRPAAVRMLEAPEERNEEEED